MFERPGSATPQRTWHCQCTGRPLGSPFGVCCWTGVWADEELEHHRTFFNTVLCGMRNGRDAVVEGQPVQLASVGGVQEVRERLAELLGIKVRSELRCLRRVRPAIGLVTLAEAEQGLSSEWAANNTSVQVKQGTQSTLFRWDLRNETLPFG